MCAQTIWNQESIDTDLKSSKTVEIEQNSLLKSLKPSITYHIISHFLSVNFAMNFDQMSTDCELNYFLLRQINFFSDAKKTFFKITS